MSVKRTKCADGLTLVEVMLAVLIIAIVALGALSYGYHGAGQIRHAREYSTAVRIAYFLLEDWKASAGSQLYASNSSGVRTPEDLNVDGIMSFAYKGKGIYEVTVDPTGVDPEGDVPLDNIPLQIKLSRPSGYQRLIPLTVAVSWNTGSIALTTNVRIDQGGD
jgi:prepilin-type N-terminal cleavage/methylation domain-containing protein